MGLVPILPARRCTVPPCRTLEHLALLRDEENKKRQGGPDFRHNGSLSFLSRLYRIQTATVPLRALTEIQGIGSLGLSRLSPVTTVRQGTSLMRTRLGSTCRLPRQVSGSITRKCTTVSQCTFLDSLKGTVSRMRAYHC